MPDGLRLAITTLTVVPLRGPRVVDRRTAGQAMGLAPLVGLLLGLVAAAVVYAGRSAEVGPLLSCSLGIATLALLTRGLHLDGVADLADGLGSYRDAESARTVMKARDVGPFGVGAVVLTLLLQVGALTNCVSDGRGTASLVLAVTAGRLAVTAACRRTPAAAPDGLGALVAGTVRRAVPTVWTSVVGVVAVGYATLDADTTGSDLMQAGRTAAALVLALGAAWLLRRHAVRRLRGITGDVLGALSELATTVCLVVLAVGS